MIGGAIDLIVRPPAHEATGGWSFSFAFAFLGFMLGLVNGKESRSQILVRRRLARHRTDLQLRVPSVTDKLCPNSFAASGQFNRAKDTRSLRMFSAEPSGWQILSFQPMITGGG